MKLELFSHSLILYVPLTCDTNHTIYAVKKNLDKLYCKIIKAGTYPGEHILCQTKRPHSYPIPHGYVIQTTWNQNKCTVQCSINYIDDKPTYIMAFGDNFSNRIVSNKSSSDAVTLFYKVS